MTAELLETLYSSELQGPKTFVKLDDLDQREGANGAAVTSVTQTSEYEQRVDKEKSDTEFEESHHRVFLLGENLWEEPSRLVGRDKQDSKTRSNSTKCLTCRGEGRLMCTECDGSGEPNIEPRFLERVDESMMCPYCDGLGYTKCDVCEGKSAV